MSNKNVVIVDYGLGNLHSVNKAVALVGGNPVITGDKEIIAAAEKLILPGVGAFGDCMTNLEKAGVIPVTGPLIRTASSNKSMLWKGCGILLTKVRLIF